MKNANESPSVVHNKHLNVRMNPENENLNEEELPRGTRREPLHYAQKKTFGAKPLQRHEPEVAFDVNNNAFSGQNGAEIILEQRRNDNDGTIRQTSSFSRKAESGRENTGEGNGAEDEKGPETEDEKEEALPWHHLQLYNFMGKEADYFLYPKLDMDKRTTKPLMTPLRNKTGYTSVNTLWAALRQDSSKKLSARVDDNFYPELKATYRAYIREYMKGHDTEDKEEQLLWGSSQVPEIEELVDDSCLRKIIERRRKAQIMFRSSLRNEDRTKILLYNNPLPDISNDCGTDSIMRFLLPAPTESSLKNDLSAESGGDESDEAAQVPDEENAENSSRINQISDEDNGAERDKFVWGDFDGQGKPKPVKCVFLTEADAYSVGRFSRKRKELMDAKAIDSQYIQSHTSRQHSAKSLMTSGQKAVASSATVTEKKRSVPAAVSYQPLTLGALMEYATKCPAPGHGSFKFGTRPMWLVQEKTFYRS